MTQSEMLGEWYRNQYDSILRVVCSRVGGNVEIAHDAITDVIINLLEKNRIDNIITVDGKVVFDAWPLQTVVIREACQRAWRLSNRWRWFQPLPEEDLMRAAQSKMPDHRLLEEEFCALSDCIKNIRNVDERNTVICSLLEIEIKDGQPCRIPPWLNGVVSAQELDDWRKSDRVQNARPETIRPWRSRGKAALRNCLIRKGFPPWDYL